MAMSKKKEREHLTLSELAHYHRLSSNNRTLIEDIALYCRCFHCLCTIDNVHKIEEWIDGGKTAICPQCGIDSVLPITTLFDIDELVQDMHDHYFGEENDKRYATKDGRARSVSPAEIQEEPSIRLDDLQFLAHETAVAKGFWDGDPKVSEKLMLVVTKVAKAMEELRDLSRDVKKTYVVDGKPEGFGTELADAVIRIAELAEHLGIDLTSMVRMKMRYNEGRPKKHGKTC
jgi:hypothetical protein